MFVDRFAGHTEGSGCELLTTSQLLLLPSAPLPTSHRQPPLFMFNPKHACLRGEAQRKADTTQTVGEDIIILVATFASCRDLCTLGCVCRRFAPLPARESLWELRALDILPSRPRLLSAMSELRITSYRQLVEAFTKIGIPGGVLGFWQAEKPSRSWAAQLEFSSRLSPPGREGPTVEEEEARGELLRISLAAGRFQCDSIAPNGTSRW